MPHSVGIRLLDQNKLPRGWPQSAHVLPDIGQSESDEVGFCMQFAHAYDYRFSSHANSERIGTWSAS